MIRPSAALALLVSLLSGSLAGCTGTFGSVGRSTRISDSARVTASSMVPDDACNRALVEHLALRRSTSFATAATRCARGAAR